MLASGDRTTNPDGQNNDGSFFNPSLFSNSFASSSTSTNSSSQKSCAGSSKIQCADYKEGTDFAVWLESFELAAQNAGLHPDGYKQPLVARLPPRYRRSTFAASKSGKRLLASDWPAIRASVLRNIVGTTDSVAQKTASDFHQMRSWSPAEEFEPYLTELLTRFYLWTDAAGYDEASVELHFSSTLIEKLRKKIPPVLRAELPQTLDVKWEQA